MQSLLEELKVEHQIEQIESGEALFNTLDNWSTGPQTRSHHRIIILDLITVFENGLDVLSKINQHPIFDQVTVIMWTSMTNYPSIEKSYRLGANLYIFKSSAYDEMLQKWKGILNFLRIIPKK